MHDVRVALDDHLFSNPHATRFRDPPDVITAEIDEHQVFGQLLWVGEQFPFQR